MEVELNIPLGFRFQMVYRKVWRGGMPAGMPLPEGFFLWMSGRDALRGFAAMKSAWGWIGAVKALAKLCTRSRLLYGVVRDGTLVHSGWITLGRCRYYRVEPFAAVIGPIWTEESLRGKGLASASACWAMATLAEHGDQVFYIDTSDDNLASQRVIAKCGFGPPLAVYIKGFPGE